MRILPAEFPLDPEGFCETVVTQRRGARFSTADAYRPRYFRKTSVCLPAPLQVVIDGDRSPVGVEYQSDGQTRINLRRREVVLCASTIESSPQLLMLSGIGDRDHRTRHRHRTTRPRSGATCSIIVTVLGFDVERTLVCRRSPAS